MRTLPLTHLSVPPHSAFRTPHSALATAAAEPPPWHCLVAETAVERTRGLLGRDSLSPGTLMLLSPCRFGLIHTIGMKFPIDVICLDKNFCVEKIVRNLPPGRMFCGTLRTRHILEAQTGWLPHIAKGDVFTLSPEVVRKSRP